MNTQKNYMRLEFPSFSCNEAFARGAVGAFLTELDPTLETLSDIKTAVSEAVTNAIVHGYPDQIGTITVSCEMRGKDTIRIEVADHGVGIPDIPAARMPLFTTGGAERSGMGFTIMERFMSRLEVRSEPGAGTTVIMDRTICEDAP